MADSTNAKKAEKTDYPPRTFVKELGDGTKLERTVTTPATEVSAKFDGFFEKPGKTSAAASSATGTKPAGSTS